LRAEKASQSRLDRIRRSTPQLCTLSRVLDSARQRLVDAGVEPDAARPLYEVVTATFADTSRAFGEPLPNGLRLGDEVRSTDLQHS
jgi:hypothetical protein